MDTEEALNDDENSLNVPRGLPKSGRPWKPIQKSRNSASRRDKMLHTSWEKKQRAKAERNAVKSLESELHEAKKQRIQEHKRIQKEREERRQENIRKAEIVQTIKNTTKMKRLKKKQLRFIKKADTSSVSKE